MKVLLTSLLLLAPAFALDLILDSITCDEALPYYATDFDMKCDGQTRCTFGEDAVIYGERKLKVVHVAGQALTSTQSPPLTPSLPPSTTLQSCTMEPRMLVSLTASCTRNLVFNS